MNRSRVIRRVAATALLATFVAACSSASAGTVGQATPVPATGAGSGPTTQPAATSTPAPIGGGGIDLAGPNGLCAILPSARAEAALGAPVGSPVARHSAAFSNASCTYDAIDSDASIAIWFYPAMTRDEWESAMAKVGMTSAMAVRDLGDAAYRRDSTTAPARTKLAVFQGDRAIWVNISGAGDLSRMITTAEREARDLLAAIG